MEKGRRRSVSICEAGPLQLNLWNLFRSNKALSQLWLATLSRSTLVCLEEGEYLKQFLPGLSLQRRLKPLKCHPFPNSRRCFCICHLQCWYTETSSGIAALNGNLVPLRTSYHTSPWDCISTSFTICGTAHYVSWCMWEKTCQDWLGCFVYPRGKAKFSVSI